MALSRVHRWKFFVAPQGGFFTVFTDRGKFDKGPLDFDYSAATLNILNGPNPGYDDQKDIFFGTNSEGLFDDTSFGNELAKF